MLFSVVNAFMMFVFGVALVAAYMYIRDRHVVDTPISAFVAVVCGSLFCAYVIVLGFSAALSELFGCVSHLFSALTALLSH
jgi:cytochrome bd-type quinol oxidase subunit 1